MNADLLDHLKVQEQLPTDAALARDMGLQASILSRARAGRAGISAGMMIVINQEYGMSIADIKALIAMGEDHG